MIFGKNPPDESRKNDDFIDEDYAERRAAMSLSANHELM
jgi:hypothetical protein